MLHRASGDLDTTSRDLSIWGHVDAVLRAILEMTADTPEDEFHLCLVRALATALGCHTTFVAQLVRGEGGVRVRTLAVWSHGGPAQNFEYPLAGTPCEEVLREGLLRVDREVGGRFPDDRVLNEIRAESYLGAALLGADGSPVGHLAALDDQPILDQGSSETILRIFASRAAAALDRKSIESQLRNVEDNFRLLFDQSPNAIILFDPETWKPVEFNDLAADFAGCTRDEFAELTITDHEMVPDPIGTREHVSKILEAGGDVFEALHMTRGGRPRNVIVSLRTTTWKGRAVMLTLWHDITDRKAAEQSLAASERRLQSIFDTAMDAIINIDENFRITRLNPAAETIFQCQAAVVVGKEIQRFLPDGTLDRLFQRPLSKGRKSGFAPIWAPRGLNAQRFGGEVFPVELTVSPFEIDGAAFGTLILRDVNDRRRAESELRSLKEDKRILQEQLSERATIVGTSPAMLGVLTHAEKVAATDSTVLILGETGTGKELIARTIHERSVRKNRVMVTVNCAALPRDLLESELFGHEKGAFTGATQRKRGRFELASGGTLFLDEVGELSAEAQAKLLRVLQEGEIQRVGGETTTRVNVRVIAATHRDLVAWVKEGQFRSDLYYRLSVFPLRLPPLRERRTDIFLLVEHFVSIYAKRFGRPFEGFDGNSMERLQAYHWPGNVRELQNVIERAAILSSGGELTLEGSLLHGLIDDALEGGDDLAEVTRRHLRRVLKECHWIVEGPNGAAIRLGIKPSTLRFRMQKLGIKKP